MKSANKTKEQDSYKMPDPVILAHALMDAYKKAQPLFEKYIKQYEGEDMAEHLSSINFDPLNIQESYIDFLEKIAKDPNKFIEIQAKHAQDWMDLWQNSMQKFIGHDMPNDDNPKNQDRRFKASEWNETALFDFIKQSYLLTCQQVENTINDSANISDEQKNKLNFQAKLFTDALSPSNFALTNPEVINETINTNGKNLVDGFKNLIKDLERGNGGLNISTTNYKAFELGKNIAVSKGRVIYQNDIMQLIQYEAKTKEINKTPLLIIPPWINKYYILDLREGNSLVEWALEQGHNVFIISWVNPSGKLKEKTFENYMDEGILSALDQIEKATKAKQVNAMGYCLGGTLLATALTYLTHKKQESRISSATFLTTLLDFKHAGDMKLFLDDKQLENIDRMMEDTGVLSGKEMHRTFSLMRANDLIWSFVVNNYLMGREPFPFDLLYWNDDCTNMPAALHSFCLKNMYRDNKLSKVDGIKVKNVPIDLSKIKTPCHFISTKEDHIAPWIATYDGAKILSGDVTFTLGASGHIAGIVNSPEKNKYCYWTNDKLPEQSEKWLSDAVQHDGSWWGHWNKWVSKYAGEKASARKIGKSIEDAPGSYVHIKY